MSASLNKFVLIKHSIVEKSWDKRPSSGCEAVQPTPNGYSRGANQVGSSLVVESRERLIAGVRAEQSEHFRSFEVIFNAEAEFTELRDGEGRFKSVPLLQPADEAVPALDIAANIAPQITDC